MYRYVYPYPVETFNLLGGVIRWKLARALDFPASLILCRCQLPVSGVREIDELSSTVGRGNDRAKLSCVPRSGGFGRATFPPSTGTDLMFLNFLKWWGWSRGYLRARSRYPARGRGYCMSSRSRGFLLTQAYMHAPTNLTTDMHGIEPPHGIGTGMQASPG